MKGIIVKNIETEIREVNNAPFYREALVPALGVATVGEVPPDVSATEITYERMILRNPETGEESSYFVRLSDRKLFEDIIKVSDTFISEKIQQSVNAWKRQFAQYDLPRIEEDWWKKGYTDFKKLPWYKRLFTFLIRE